MWCLVLSVWGLGACAFGALCFLFWVWVTRRTSHVTRQTSHVTRHTSHVTRHTSHVTRHSFDLRLWVLVLGFGYALCILMNISYYRYSIVWGGWCLSFVV